MASERVQRRIDRLLDQVEEAADGQDWPRVRELCEEVLGLDPDNPDAPAFLLAAERRLSGSGAVSAGPGPAGSRPRGEEAPVTPSAVQTAEVPTSFADGRYMVKSFLGEGGKKRVSLAHDELL
jgi:hypothetical protein